MSLFPCSKYYEKKNTESCFRLVNNQAQPMSHSFLTIKNGITPIKKSGGICSYGQACCTYDKNGFDKANQTTCNNNPHTPCVTDADCPSSDFCNTCKQGYCQLSTKQCSKTSTLPCTATSDCPTGETCTNAWSDRKNVSCYNTGQCQANFVGQSVRCTTETAGYTLNKTQKFDPWLPGFVCNEINTTNASRTVAKNCTFGPSLPTCRSNETAVDSNDGCFPTFFKRICVGKNPDQYLTMDKSKEACHANTPATKYAAWSKKDNQCFRFPDSCSIVPDANYDLTYSR